MTLQSTDDPELNAPARRQSVSGLRSPSGRKTFAYPHKMPTEIFEWHHKPSQLNDTSRTLVICCNLRAMSSAWSSEQSTNALTAAAPSGRDLHVEHARCDIEEVQSCADAHDQIGVRVGDDVERRGHPPVERFSRLRAGRHRLRTHQPSLIEPRLVSRGDSSIARPPRPRPIRAVCCRPPASRRPHHSSHDASTRPATQGSSTHHPTRRAGPSPFRRNPRRCRHDRHPPPWRCARCDRRPSRA